MSPDYSSCLHNCEGLMITSFLKEENMNEVREIEPNLFRQYTKYKGGFAIMPQELKGKLSLHLPSNLL